MRRSGHELVEARPQMSEDELVSFDALTHKREGETDKTECGLIIPLGASEHDDTDRCPECFKKPRAKAKKA